MTYLPPKIWEKIPPNIREKDSLRMKISNGNLIHACADCAKGVYNIKDRLNTLLKVSPSAFSEFPHTWKDCRDSQTYRQMTVDL